MADMRVNRYAKFNNSVEALDDYVNTVRTHGFNTTTAAITAKGDLIARIAELTPPKDENLRDHAEHILRVHGLLNPTPSTVDEAGKDRAQTRLAYWLRERGVSTSGIGDILDRIIDALGWAPATPAVELTPDELRSAAVIVEAFRELHAQTCKLNDDAIDAVPSVWPLPIIGAQLPVAVVCGESDWVLRIGGCDE